MNSVHWIAYHHTTFAYIGEFKGIYPPQRLQTIELEGEFWEITFSSRRFKKMGTNYWQEITGLVLAKPISTQRQRFMDTLYKKTRS